MVSSSQWLWGLIIFIWSTECISCHSVSKKNVLLIISDDLRPQLNAYAGEDFPAPVYPKMHTPHIDALANEGIVFRRAYAQNAICNPSRASFLTGRRPDTTKTFLFKRYWRTYGGNFTTIPQFFKEQGYFTAGFGKVFHPGPLSGYDDPVSWSQPSDCSPDYWSYWGLDNSTGVVEDSQEASVPDHGIARCAMENMEKVVNTTSSHQPFFFAVGFNLPHLPWIVPKRFFDYYPDNGIRMPSVPNIPAGETPDVALDRTPQLRYFTEMKKLGFTATNWTLPEEKVKSLRRAYYASVSFVDYLVGLVTQKLKDLGLADDTIVVFMGDHGYHLGELGIWEKKTSFEYAIRTPLIIRVPGQTDKGIVTRHLVELVDLFPTLADLAGVDHVPQCPLADNAAASPALCTEGTSLVPLMTNPSRSDWKDAAFTQHIRVGLPGYPTLMGYSIRTDRFRYNRWVAFSYENNTRNWDDVYAEELYDYQLSPEENENYAEDSRYSAVKDSLKKKLFLGWRGDASPTKPSPSQTVASAPLKLLVYIAIFYFQLLFST